MPFSGFQREVAVVALKVAAAHGFVLGGGNALILHGIVDRYTADVDLMTDREDGVKAATGAVDEALRAAGFEVERQDRDGGLAEMFYGFDTGLAEWLVTGPGGEQTVLQITHFDRGRAPVQMAIGPVEGQFHACDRNEPGLAGRAGWRTIQDHLAGLRHVARREVAHLGIAGAHPRRGWCLEGLGIR